jgi:predicted metalloprotease with PDZ domain
VDTLDMTFVMAGRIGRYQATGAGPFYGVWQGSPPFDAAALLGWAATLREHYLAFFHAAPAGYGIFLRHNPVNPGGGIGGFRSFVITYGAGRGSDAEELKFTLAHEMFHTFQPMLRAADTAGESLEYSWFNEGLAVYYQQALPWRAGMIDADALLRNVNFHAGRYYTNAFGNVPNSAVPARFWQDTRIRTLPYDRGFLYFVSVDEALRRVSRGRRSLDDLVVELRTEQERGAVLRPADWERVLRRELGARGVAGFHAMLAGASPLPGSGAFGPCFRRIARPLRRYEIGFAPAVLTESPRVVRDLLPGSAAERAGLRNGDVITRPVGQDDLQGRQDGILTLQVERGGQPLTIAYLPRGETVSAWQWQRVPSTARRSCRR